MLQQQIRMNTISISHWNHLHFSTDLQYVHLGDGDCRAHSWVVQSKIQREQSHRPHMTVLNIQVCREYISLYNSIFKFHNFIVHKTSNFISVCSVIENTIKSEFAYSKLYAIYSTENTVLLY